jgi:PAS domain S-box-containing protein
VVDLRKTRKDLEARVRERTSDLAERDAFRKAMEDSLLVGMRARDLEGRVTYVNPALCDITGYSANDLLGRLPPYPYWHPEEYEKHWQDNDLALKGQAAPTGYESRFRHRLGHDIYVMVYTAPLIDAAGKHSGWMSSMVDITAQKKAEEAQRTQATKMQSTARLAIVGEMASTLAHELGNPLMAISSDAALARTCAQGGHGAQLLETLGDISVQAQRAAEIVRRIRGFVRQHTPGFQDCAVNEVVNNVLALLRPELRHQRAKAMVCLAHILPPIQADRLLLEQVILNLVVNAVQAMHERHPVDKVVEVETGRIDDFVFIRVSDRGPGIPPEIAEMLFAPFFTTKPEGLGLGLNICRTTVESHRGRLDFENRPEGGATFTVYLPITP